jgi:hypothetical protein
MGKTLRYTDQRREQAELDREDKALESLFKTDERRKDRKGRKAERTRLRDTTKEFNNG